MITDIVSMSFAGILILLFLLFAYRDLGMLLRRPAKNMGTGLSRIWAVGRTTMMEAWASYVWFVPILWVLAALVIMLAIRPFDETERITLDIRALLTSQEILLLVMFWILACVSLPRERERKIVITNASKPLSRLEYMGGKMVGFSAICLLMIVIMTIMSWGILYVADQRIRSNAAAEYALAESDFKARSQATGGAVAPNEKESSLPGAKSATLVPPPLEKKRLAEEGTLVAYNNITVPEENMSIVGNIRRTSDGKLVRFLKGGSQETAIYRFKKLLAPDAAEFAPAGQRPYFRFQFPVIPYISPNPTPEEMQKFLELKKKIAIEVTAVRAKQRLKEQNKLLYLDVDAGGVAYWEPDDVAELFTLVPNGRDNGEIEVTVSCPTPGVFLEVLDGSEEDPSPEFGDFNVLAADTHATSYFQLTTGKPRIRGFERRDRQQISGPTKQDLAFFGNDPPLETAIFRFPKKSLRHVPTDGKGHFKLSMLLDVDKESNPELDTLAWIQAYNDNSANENSANMWETSTNIIEKRSTDVLMPESLLGGPDPDKRGDLVILLHCATPGHWLSLLPDSLRIEEPPTPFVLNLFKSELVIFFEVALLIIVCVACSVRLGWPVAMLTALFIFFFGSMRAFVAGVLDTGGLLALGIPGVGPKSDAYYFFNHVTGWLWRFLNFAVSFTPDFTRFDYLKDIVMLRNMPNLDLAVACGWMCLYALPIIGIGYLLFRKQELG